MSWAVRWSADSLRKSIELRGKKLVLSECGHGYRATRCEGPNWAGMDVPFEMESSVLTMLRYIQEGRIKVDKTKNDLPVTFHDSCNNARSCGFFEEPRELLNLVVTDFREMYPNRAENYCCSRGRRGHVHVGIYALCASRPPRSRPTS